MVMVVVVSSFQETSRQFPNVIVATKPDVINKASRHLQPKINRLAPKQCMSLLSRTVTVDA